jgi:hypothetical protein
MEHILSKTEDYLFWLMTSLAGGIGWLVRRVLTNQKQIALLEAEMATRAKLREEDRERMAKIEKQNTQILGVLLREVSDGED